MRSLSKKTVERNRVELLLTEYIIIFLSASLISAFSQILLKLAAKKNYSSWIYEYLNIKVIIAYGIFFLATLITVYCYKVVPLSLGAMLEASGYYWSEICGCKSMGTVTLRAITDLSDRNNVNINLFTHLEFDRVMHLVTEEGKTVAEAKAQAESEILASFGIDVQLENPEDLNIFESGDGNAALLAVSVLMQGNADAADLSERMGDISTTLASEGSWDNPKTKVAMADWASEADVYGMFPDLLRNLREWGNDEVPDFVKYVRSFWYDIYGLGACTEAREGEVAADSNKQSVFYYKKSDLRFVCESGKWKKAETIESDVDDFGAGTEGEMRAGSVNSQNKYVYDNGKWREATSLELEVGAGCTAAMPAKIESGYICKEGAWNVAKNSDYDAIDAECVEGETIVGAKTSME